MLSARVSVGGVVCLSMMSVSRVAVAHPSSLSESQEALQAKLTALAETNACLNARLKDQSEDRRIDHLTHDVSALRQQLAQASQKRHAARKELDTLRRANQTLQRLQKDRLTLQANLTALTEETQQRKQAMRELVTALQQAQQLVQEQAHFKLDADTLRATLQRDRGEPYRELGALYTKAQLFDRAINAYQKSLEADPDHAQTHYYLGLLYQHAKHNDERAVAHLQRYLALSPTLGPKQRQDIEYVINMLPTKVKP